MIRPILHSNNLLQKYNINTEENTRSKGYFPTEIAKLYNFPDNLDGEGQCIALLEFGGGGYSDSDINEYFSKLDIPIPNISAVGSNTPTGYPNSVDGEILLDIEVAATIAPKAKIIVYFFQDFEAELANAITTAVHDTDNKPSIISISYGLWEDGGWTESLRKTVDDACIDAGLFGVTICVASGDDGSSCIRPGKWNHFKINDDKVHVSFPASSPNVLTCGGTNIEVSDNGTITETVWNENKDDGGATGGGISEYFDIPTYQKELNLPSSLNGDGLKRRGVYLMCRDMLQVILEFM